MYREKEASNTQHNNNWKGPTGGIGERALDGYTSTPSRSRYPRFNPGRKAVAANLARRMAQIGDLHTVGPGFATPRKIKKTGGSRTPHHKSLLVSLVNNRMRTPHDIVSSKG